MVGRASDGCQPRTVTHLAALEYRFWPIVTVEVRCTADICRPRSEDRNGSITLRATQAEQCMSSVLRLCSSCGFATAYIRTDFSGP